MSKHIKTMGLTIENGVLQALSEKRHEVVKTISIDDLVSLEADSKYVVAIGGGHELLLSPSMVTMEPYLPDGFLRLSRSVIVALRAVSGHRIGVADTGGPRQTVTMADGSEFSISRREWPAVRDAVSAYQLGQQA